MVLTYYFPHQIEYRRDKMVLIRLGADKIWYSKYEYRHRNKGTDQVWHLKDEVCRIEAKKATKNVCMYTKINARYTIEMMNKKRY